MEVGTEARPSIATLWSWLEQVPDPEIPAVSVVDLGIVRDVVWDPVEGDVCIVTVTPTYSGCPATDVIGNQIRDALEAHGVARVRLELQLSPAWTTDWLSQAAREKLRVYGIAPPVAGGVSEQAVDLSQLRRNVGSTPSVECPRCGSSRTELTSQFGSTPCKALYRCNACLEPFDYFKCH